MASLRNRLEWISLILGALILAATLPSHAKEIQQATLEQFGFDIAVALQEGDQSGFAAMIDFQKLANRMSATAMDTEAKRESYARGFLKAGGPEKFSKALFVHLKQQQDLSVKFMRVVDRGSERRALVRLNMGEAGFEYLEFVVENDGRKAPRIVDWYPLTSGELISTSVGGLSRLLTDPDPHLLKTLFGLQGIDTATVDRMKHIAQLRARGELQQAYQEMGKLPPEIATSRILLTQRAALASSFGDDDAYRKTLEELALRYADQPGTAFMLIDHYMYKQDYARCLDAIGNVEKRVGQDGLTSMLRANVQMLANKVDAAAQSLRDGIRIEPDFTDAYFILVDLLIGKEQFTEAVDVFETLQTEFGYEFSREAIEAEPSYAKFIVSPAYKVWQQ